MRPVTPGFEEVDDSSDVFDLELREDEDIQPTRKKKRKAKEADEEPESAIDHEMRRAMDNEIAHAEAAFRKEATAEIEAPDAVDVEAKRKQKRQLAIGGVALLSFALIGYFAFSGGSKPKPQLAAPRDPAPIAKVEEKKPEPPKIEPPKKVEKPPEPMAVAPEPRLAAREGIPFAASRMLSERSDAPAAFDKSLFGKVLLVYGTCGSVSNETIRLADRETDQGGITCFLIPESVSPTLQPGQAVAICGLYTGDLHLAHCSVVRVSASADEEFKDKEIELAGVVAPSSTTAADTDLLPTLILQPPLTDTLITIRCLFRQTERESVSKLRPGQPVTIRGRCEGRTFRVVRLHDCTIVPPTESTTGATRAAAERFFAAYEADLLPVPRPDPAVPPIFVTAEQLAVAFEANLAQANATYRYKLVEVTGKVLQRTLGTNTVILETGTRHKFQIEAIFMPSQFATLRDERSMTIRGVCVGVRGGSVRLENGQRFDPEAANPAVRTTASYLPLQSGREAIYDFLSVEKAGDNPILRYQVLFVGEDLIRSTPIRAGHFPARTLFGDPAIQPKWTRDFTKVDPKVKNQSPPTRLTRYRVQDGTIEFRDVPPPPAQPSAWWDPVFKLGMKHGESWSGEMPDGATVTYTVMGFSKGENARQMVEIRRVLKSTKESTVWEESKIMYAVGVGEVSRIVTKQSAAGQSFTGLEMRLVEAGTDPKPPEKK
ncbi:MAG: OB-fold putative lipoprotein [Planctomycetes bacterium]|nr:OB-fold putative lipoprotein [Planctomycetota bacterium]